MKLTIAQLEQLLSYCNMMEIEGHYYGNKGHWDARHTRIKHALQSELEKCIAKEQDNERRAATQN